MSSCITGRRLYTHAIQVLPAYVSLPLGSPQALSPLLPSSLPPPRSHYPPPPEANESPVIHFRLSWVIAAPPIPPPMVRPRTPFFLCPPLLTASSPSSFLLPHFLGVPLPKSSALRPSPRHLPLVPSVPTPLTHASLMIVLFEGQSGVRRRGRRKTFPSCWGLCMCGVIGAPPHPPRPLTTSAFTPSCRLHQPLSSITHPYHLPFPLTSSSFPIPRR